MAPAGSGSYIAGEEPNVEARRVLVEISASALGSAHVPSAETAAPIQSEGRTEVERVSRMDDSPRIAQCSIHGIRDLYPDNLA
jgi:hypothetical protein